MTTTTFSREDKAVQSKMSGAGVFLENHIESIAEQCGCKTADKTATAACQNLATARAQQSTPSG